MDPGWASISRGVLVCDECCSVHRSLGRHISIVKHLRHSAWPPTLLQMVHTLASNGANSIWEHSLLDPAQVQSGRRKANPQDKVHPIKSEFIRAKYQMLAFVHKLPCRDDDGVTAKDLSKQLHSSVRTGNLETCLRLLSLGAQANFFHPEKGTTPLHVAAKAGQTLQAELLVVYGADPGSPDVNGRTPIDYARQAGHHELAERLVECQYELTDRLAFYLCGRKPVWLATQNHSTLVTERSAVPFLPVNPEYSATRNQGRQKLARFNAREFATLIIDILSEAKRRQQGKSLSSPTDNLELSAQSQSDLDDQHDYDSVASDEDTDQEPLPSTGATRNNRARSMDSSDLSDGAVTLQEYLELKKALATSEARVEQLMQVNSSLSDELRRLQREIHKLQAENLQLRQPSGPTPTPPLPNERAEHVPMGPAGSTHRRDRQAFSMYEPGSALKPFGGAPGDELTTRLQPFHSTELEDDAIYSVHVPTGLYRIRKGVSASSVPFTPSSPLLSCSPEGSRHTSKLSRHGSGADSDYENTQSGDPPLGLEGKRFLELGKEDELHPELESLEGDLDPGLPSTEDVILKTEQVTKNIQELLRAAQEFKHDSFVPCSEKIHLAVTEMASLFPKVYLTKVVTPGMYASALEDTVDTSRLFRSCSLREFEETLFCHTKSFPISWDTYWDLNDPLRDVDEAAVPVLCICSADDPLCGPPDHTLPTELFQSNPYFFLLLSKCGGHCGFLRPEPMPAWSHEVILESFRALTEFFRMEERMRGLSRRRTSFLAGRRRWGGLQKREVSPSSNLEEMFNWKRSYTRQSKNHDYVRSSTLLERPRLETKCVSPVGVTSRSGLFMSSYGNE
ncbi:ARF GTPase-activating protein GIT1-like protein [Cricetulus griseus]|nr:ARF GTPase-activating protein GIT1-like protein [Cricetulus griseus]